MQNCLFSQLTCNFLCYVSHQFIKEIKHLPMKETLITWNDNMPDDIKTTQIRWLLDLKKYLLQICRCWSLCTVDSTRWNIWWKNIWKKCICTVEICKKRNKLQTIIEYLKNNDILETSISIWIGGAPTMREGRHVYLCNKKTLRCK